MTNGEKIKEIFPKAYIKMPTIFETKVKVIIDLDCEVKFPIEWWDAKYKEPTTKNNLAHNLCDSCTNIRCEFQSGIVRTKCAFYMPPQHSSELEKNSKKLEKNIGELDCISRADAIQAMQDKTKKITNEDTINGLCGAVAILFDLPSVTPQEPRWIPVSEKLPKPYMFVNATCRSLVDDRENWVIETLYLPIPKEVNEQGYSDWGNIPMLNWGEAEVIAWVERIIPQPYKAETEDT